jgi:hypothetical protein
MDLFIVDFETMPWKVFVRTFWQLDYFIELTRESHFKNTFETFLMIFNFNGFKLFAEIANFTKMWTYINTSCLKYILWNQSLYFLF